MPENQQIPILLYSRKSAAFALSISIRKLDYDLAAGAFETRRNGRKVLITASSLKRYAAANHFGRVNGTKEEAAPKKHAVANGSDEEAALKKNAAASGSEKETA
jgi:hypothetical protein